MDAFLFPGIESAGIFDSDIVRKDIICSEKRLTGYYELELLLQDGGITYIDGQTYHIRSGAVICAKPGSIRHSRFPLRCYYLHFYDEPGPICEFLSSLPDYFLPTQTELLKRLLSDITMSYSFPAADNRFYITGNILQLLHVLQQEVQQKQTADHFDHPLLCKAISYMDQHYTEYLTLEALAAHLNCNPIYLHRLFRDSYDITPYRYLLEKRLEEACKLLYTTALPLSEIAIRTGFSSQSHFGAVFKKVTGKTPQQYRKEMLLPYLL